MKNEQIQDQIKPITKLLGTPLHLYPFVIAFLLFSFCGLAIGIIFFSPIRGISFNYALNKLPIQASIPLISNEIRENVSYKHGFNENLNPPMIREGMADEELLQRASLVPRILQFDQIKAVPKVAFLFLTRGPLPLAPLWEKFFRGHEGHYTIYLHTHPSYNETVPSNSVFYGRRIRSKEVQWGKFNMVEAERRLLANALLDPSNERFVLLSESCIPLFNFSTVYSHLMASTQTFVESYVLPGPTGQGRYKRRLGPTITPEQWRKGSQWFQIDRDLAVAVVSDGTYFPTFAKVCKTAPCYADEHYLPTFVNIRFGRRNSNRSLTWVDWSRGGSHPSRYRRWHVTVGLLSGMRNGRRCTYNGKKTSVCSLFARKFLPSSLDRLLRIAPKLMSFN